MLTWFKLKNYKRSVGRWLLFTLAVFCLFGLINVVRAQTDFGLNQQFSDTSGLSDTNLIVIVAKIIRAVLGLLGIIAVILIIYAGWMWMTSQGEEEKIGQAKKILINAVIGLAIIMSSLAIAQFVLSRFSSATGSGLNLGIPAAPVFKNFNGSGALGRAVKDHYPTRDQTDVYRNTRISVTFRDSISPSSIIDNSNNSCINTVGDVTTTASGVNCPDTYTPNYGDCLTDKADFNWERDCDHLKTTAIKIYATDNNESTVGSEASVSSTIMAVYEGGTARNVYTIVIRPTNLLGSSTTSVWYATDLLGVIKKKDGSNLFSGGGDSGHYIWWFQTGVNSDFTPPTVETVYPLSGMIVGKNTVVQINFSEPMDPTSVQGMINNGDNSFTNLIFNTTAPSGEWKISNGYQTVEFISNTYCGVNNSCGERMYCLPVVCTEGVDCKNDYLTLVRTASTLPNTWEALPFTGVSDISGNALDGNANNIRNGKPTMPGDQRTLLVGEIQPDNYTWSFGVSSTIDMRVPYVNRISPAVDQSYVSPEAPLTMLFSLPMMKSTLYSIGLAEFPTQNNINNIWFYPRSINIGTGNNIQTETALRHRVFGPNGKDLFYFPSVAGTVKSLNQNCLYPGRGPGSSIGGDTCQMDSNGNYVNCLIPTGFSANNDTGCSHGEVVSTTASDLGECLNNILPGVSNY